MPLIIAERRKDRFKHSGNHVDKELQPEVARELLKLAVSHHNDGEHYLVERGLGELSNWLKTW